MTTPATRVAIVEDHESFSRTLANIIDRTPGFSVCATVQDLDDAVAFVDHTCPDILLVDLGLPSGSGLALIHHAHRRWRGKCACAVLTMTGNEVHLCKAIFAGAQGYLFKSDDESVWVDGIRTLACGGGLIHAGLARHLAESQETHPLATVQNTIEFMAAGYRFREIALRMGLASSEEVAIHVSRYYAWLRENSLHLSERESQLLELLNQGFSFKQSAQRMNIQESTVKTLATRAYQKLGANNLPEALYAARREHLLR